MEKRHSWIIALGALGAVLSTLFVISSVKELVEIGKKKSSKPTIEEIIDRNLSQLPMVVHESEYSKFTQTGIEKRLDTLLLTYTVEAVDYSVYQSKELDDMMQQSGIEGLKKDYDSTLLMRKACDAHMVISYRYFDPDGALLYSWDFSPQDYLSILR